MTDCMLSEERIEALANAIHDSYYSDTATGSTADIIRRFFAPPPGSVKVEVAVVVCGKEMAAVANDVGDREKAMREARDCIFTTELTHECYATLYVPPVPPTPSVEVVS
jgi:hypothetical protein